MATFGENLKRLRRERKVSQEVLAERLGLQRQATVSAWEKGRRAPRAATVRRIAKALGCKPKELLVGIETDYDRLRGSSVPLAPAPDQPVIRRDVLNAIRDEDIAEAAIALAQLEEDQRQWMIALIRNRPVTRRTPLRHKRKRRRP